MDVFSQMIVFFSTFARKTGHLSPVNYHLSMHTAYLAPVSYYRQMLRTRPLSFVCDADDRWQKQTLRNRCYIDSPSGALALTVPVVHPVPGALTRDIVISEHGAWRHQHWNALCSSYRQTPFFDYYEEDFRPFYEEGSYHFLVDFNAALQDTVLSLLGISPESGPVLEGCVRREGVYYQQFAPRHGFLDDLSIVDLLFNMGPESVFYL